VTPTKPMAATSSSSWKTQAKQQFWTFGPQRNVPRRASRPNSGEPSFADFLMLASWVALLPLSLPGSAVSGHFRDTRRWQPGSLLDEVIGQGEERARTLRTVGRSVAGAERTAARCGAARSLGRQVNGCSRGERKSASCAGRRPLLTSANLFDGTRSVEDRQ
jgi:hypothetical protein